MSLKESRVSRAEALARLLETEITSQALAPGDRLGTKDGLRERFGVAVGTVNEAIRLMEMRGLVAPRPGPGGGVFVSDVATRARLGQELLGLDWGTLGDCAEVRGGLEPLVCRGAAEAHTQEDIDDLQAIVDEMEAQLNDSHGYLRVNWRFHRRIATICRNSPLRSIYLSMIDFLEAGLDEFDFHDAEDLNTIAVHRELAEAIAEGPGDRLERAIEAHRRRSPLPPA